MKKKLILVFGLGLLVLNVTFVALYFLVISPSSESEPEEEVVEALSEEELAAAQAKLTEDYYSVHFNFGDAVELCSIEAQSRNSNLIQLSVNEHSSRFMPETELYLIKLDSQVGTPFEYDIREHSCEIDPRTQGVAFYKEITRKTVVRPQG